MVLKQNLTVRMNLFTHRSLGEWIGDPLGASTEAPPDAGLEQLSLDFGRTAT